MIDSSSETKTPISDRSSNVNNFQKIESMHHLMLDEAIFVFIQKST